MTDVLVMPPELVRSQIAATATDMDVAAVKTGALGSAEVVEAVADALGEWPVGPVVVDPVMMATSGGALARPGTVEALRERLLPRCAVFTPNIPEAQAVLGTAIHSRDDMVGAAHALGALGPAAVVVKGGHLPAADSPDLLWEDGRITWLEGDRIPAVYARGTGCAFSAGVAAGLALGRSVEEASRAAKDFVAAAIVAGRG